MKKLAIIDLIKVDPYSSTAKYLQIVNAVLKEIEKGNIRAGDNMPSINELSIELDVARDTAERGYRQLRKLGVLNAVPRRGYFIENTSFRRPLNLFLLFNKLSTPKKAIYDSMVKVLGEQAGIDLYIYNNDYHLFKRLLASNKEHYTHLVIIPHFVDGGENAAELINSIPKEKLIVLDNIVPGVKGEFGSILIDFKNDIYQALTEALDRLAKYHTIKIIFPRHSYYPKEILQGFTHFCQDNAFAYEVIGDVTQVDPKQGEVYINLMEDDLVTLIEKIQTTSLVIGQDVGIISYNETPIKKVVLQGITTMSSDFEEMGVMAAQAILNGSTEKHKVPFRLRLRPSL
ncbi:GntR family transcriptional regulator [Flavihumibacter petaseus]|uniref:Putative GntR family transcriptional regulator n=1 Tax=Flavihumibacter petaseus NBRC 106054 TaxID=1220578 RepID=A0A0E9MZU7_9BACT|nr:GntR family transcriptional regulator [Flavihumibacter petaseus]GAO43094.1 putative GntR family transcriptional regulator [Flavihumibacter petaseus NBRC 106054]